MWRVDVASRMWRVIVASKMWRAVVALAMAQVFFGDGISAEEFQRTKPCRHTVQATNGVIESPNYGRAYPAHSDCLYYIKAPEGKVRLTFQEFKVDSHANCTKDYVQVYNFRSWSPKLCGDTPPDEIIGPDGDMYVFFFSDDFASDRGWQATFSQVMDYPEVTDYSEVTVDSDVMEYDGSDTQTFSDVTTQS